MKLWAKSLMRIKLALRTRIVKIGGLLLSQFGLLAALKFQLFWMVRAHKTMELRSETCLKLYIGSQPERRTCIETDRKKIYLQGRRVHPFPDSLVLFNLVCTEVDVLILHLSFEIREAMIRFSILSLLFR